MVKMLEELDRYRSVDRRRNLTKAEFDRAYGLAAVPVCIEDIAEDWPAMKKWDFDFFKSNYGDQEVNLVTIIDGKRRYREFELGLYLEYVQEGPYETPFYMNSEFHFNTPLRNDYGVPDYLQCWYKKLPSEEIKHPLSWIYIGPKHSMTGLHLDIYSTSAWNVVIKGLKLWVFYPPEQAEYLSRGVNPFDPDYEAYPDFRKTNPLVCLQQPGELVFTPSNWWHAVFNVEAGIAVTENFINETNYQEVLAYFQANEASPAVIEKFERLVKANLSNILN